MTNWWMKVSSSDGLNEKAIMDARNNSCCGVGVEVWSINGENAIAKDIIYYANVICGLPVFPYVSIDPEIENSVLIDIFSVVEEYRGKTVGIVLDKWWENDASYFEQNYHHRQMTIPPYDAETLYTISRVYIKMAKARKFEHILFGCPSWFINKYSQRLSDLIKYEEVMYWNFWHYLQHTGNYSWDSSLSSIRSISPSPSHLPKSIISWATWEIGKIGIARYSYSVNTFSSEKYRHILFSDPIADPVIVSNNLWKASILRDTPVLDGIDGNETGVVLEAGKSIHVKDILGQAWLSLENGGYIPTKTGRNYNVKVGG